MFSKFTEFVRLLLAAPGRIGSLDARTQDIANNTAQMAAAQLRIEQGLQLLEAGIEERLQSVESYLGVRHNRIEERLQSMGSDLGAGHNRIEERIQSMESDLGAWPNRIEARLQSFENDLGGRHNRLDQVLLGIENGVGEGINRLGGRLNEMETSAFESGNRIVSELNEFRNVILPEMSGEVHEAAAAVMAHAGVAAARDSARPRPDHDASLTIDVALERARHAFPELYPQWKARLDATAGAFATTKIGNAANVGDAYTRLFKAFVERLAKGQILDAGCGPFGVPTYLADIPVGRLSGLEPLPFAPSGDFACVRGIGEYLPWADGAFETVISATSLDHCLSLSGTLAEFRRVLAPGGEILLWIGSSPGAPAFDETDASCPGSDEFHLFHFDVSWFDSFLEDRFEIRETQRYRRVGYSHVFYRLSPKRAYV